MAVQIIFSRCVWCVGGACSFSFLFNLPVHCNSLSLSPQSFLNLSYTHHPSVLYTRFLFFESLFLFDSSIVFIYFLFPFFLLRYLVACFCCFFFVFFILFFVKIVIWYLTASLVLFRSLLFLIPSILVEVTEREREKEEKRNKGPRPFGNQVNQTNETPLLFSCLRSVQRKLSECELFLAVSEKRDRETCIRQLASSI